MEKKKNNVRNMNSDERMSLFEEFAEDKLFLEYEVFEFLFPFVFSTEDRFITNLCKIIESGRFVLSKHRDFLKSKPQQILEIITKILDLCEIPDFSAGIIISPVVETGEANSILLKEIESGKIQNQRFVFHALLFAVRFDDWEKIEETFFQIQDIYSNLEIKEDYVYIQLLVEIFYIKNELVYKELKTEISKKTENIALSFVKASIYRDTIDEYLFKESIQILETMQNQIVDMALCKAYIFDQEFVVDILESRIAKGEFKRFCTTGLKKIINDLNPFPVVEMLQSYIDENGYINGHSIQFLFEDLLNPKQWLEWCEINKRNKKLEKAIQISLSKILSGFINYKNDKIRDRAISFVKELSKKKSIDYDEFTRKIDLGKDKNDIKNNKENTLKALYVLKEMLFPIRQIDINVLKENLNKYRYIPDTFGLNWILKNARSQRPHKICFIFDRKANPNDIKELERLIQDENDILRKGLMEIDYRYLISIEREQKYWNDIFRKLSERSLAFKKSKLRNPEESDGLLVEAEIWSLISEKLEIEFEPQIVELLPKKLDFHIKMDMQNPLIETKYIDELIEHSLNLDPIMSRPGEKIFSVLRHTFQGQLYGGKRDPKEPIIIVLCLHRTFNNFDAANAILGELCVVIEKDEELKETESLRRHPNGFFFEKNAEIVSAIVVYRRDFSAKDIITGNSFLPPQSIKIKNPISEKNHKKIISSLFRNSNQ